MHKRLIIGCGAGRTGTSTLAALLNMQPGSYVTHERYSHRLKWNDGSAFAQKMLKAFAGFDGDGLYGDVALQWGSTAQLFLDEGARVVVTKRDLASWLTSWQRKSGRRDNWRPKDEGGTPEKSPWFDAFPKFSACQSKEEALTAYYRHYYDEVVGALANRWPEQVTVCDIEAFNSEAGQRQLLLFCGVEADRQLIEVGIRKNASRPKEE
ncbi:MAG: hypothetical protein HOP16_12790 [Acidobacteria bacterium]|nr:hypothetical protein [Acidobacteriota bacterium]